MTSEKRPRPALRLQGKLVLLLLLATLLPLGFSFLLIGEVGRLAQENADSHLSEFRPHLLRAQDANRQLIAAKKEAFAQRCARIATRLQASQSPNDLLSLELNEYPELLALVYRDSQGATLAEARRDYPETELRTLSIEKEVPSGSTLSATFLADMSPIESIADLDKVLHISEQVQDVNSSLPDSFRLAFIALVSGVALLAVGLAIFLARRTTNRLRNLVEGSRAGASGNLDARVIVSGNDELSELGSAFNHMFESLQEERRKTLYLQRIGAWQDVARKIAHEIKNPLTPIQLVVQQVVSSYPGGDDRYQELLNTCDEIVGEEIAGLRRLIDAFRDLGRLPKVESSPLSVDQLLADIEGIPKIAKAMDVEGETEGLVVQADRLLLRRVLVNLLENGLEASEEGNEAKVLLEISSSADKVIFRIHDAGPGVDEDMREQIFDPYVTTKETGTGLGLAIAKKIVLDHHGSLSLSAQPSRLGGALFSIEMPRPSEGPDTDKASS